MRNRALARGITLLASIGALMGVFSVQPALAADGSSGPVRIIVPYPAGGNSDNIARLYARRLSQQLSQNFIIDNRPGAAGEIGAALAAKSPADGRVLFLAPTAIFVVTPHLRKLPYDPLKDFVPIAKLTSWIPLLAVRKNLPVDNFAQFVAYAKQNPGKLTYASAGTGTMMHLVGKMMDQKLGIVTEHVPYKGSSEFITDLVAGRIDIAYDSVVLPQILSGQVKVLASLADLRHPALPNVPTLRELKVDIGFPNWYGLFAPKGTPQAVIDRIGQASKVVMQSMGDQASADSLKNMSMFASYKDSAAFRQELKQEDRFFNDLIVSNHIKVE